MKVKEEIGMNISLDNTTFIVDPYNEFPTTEPNETNPNPNLGLIDSFNNINSSIGNKLKSIPGSVRIASNEEYIGYLTNDSNTILGYYGPGRWISLISSDILSGIHSKQGVSVLLFDNFNNELSTRRYSKEKNNKTLELLQNETTINTVILLTLSGITTVYVNQWEISTRTVKYLLKNIYSNWNSNNDLTTAIFNTRNSMNKLPEIIEEEEVNNNKSKTSAKKSKKIEIIEETEPTGECKNRIKFTSAIYGIGMLQTSNK